MKPHRIKHMREKAIRQSNMTDVAKTREDEWQKRLHRKKTSLVVVGENLIAFEDRLKPIDKAKAKFVLNYFINHWVREKTLKEKNHHRHKRTTPGEVEGEGPYTVIENFPNTSERRWERKNLAKRNDIDHKMIKIQNQHHKKAA